ncbi:MAG: alpha/beta hydrolase [Pseudomonadota bacterium]
MTPQILQTIAGDIAYHKTDGTGPTVVFCGGFMSDMTGTKAIALEEHCKAKGQAFVRFDYRGHGASSGVFKDHVISDWLQDTLAVLNDVAQGDIVLIGSSMGGWIGAHAALALPDRVKSLILIAPALDFTQRMMEPAFTDAERAALAKDGYILQPTDYGDDPHIITRALLEDGKTLSLLHGPIDFHGRVRILHGQRDTAVPWDLSLEIASALATPDVEITFVKDSDHRFSELQDLAHLLRCVDALS